MNSNRIKHKWLLRVMVLRRATIHGRSIYLLHHHESVYAFIS
jgi:hypothetical protein